MTVGHRQLPDIKVSLNEYSNTFQRICSSSCVDIIVTLDRFISLYYSHDNAKIIFLILDCTRVRFDRSPDMKNGREDVSNSFLRAEEYVPKTRSPQKVAFAISESIEVTENITEDVLHRYRFFDIKYI